MGQYFSNDKLPSDVREIKCEILGRKFTFLSDNGVFSKKGIDFGSRLLLSSIPMEEVGANVLDVGCGYGTIGIIVKTFTNSYIDMVDVNKRAVALAEKNIKLNNVDNINVFESNIYSNVKDKYDTIITNPPIRAGKKVVYEILMGAKKYLKENGKLYLVIRKEQGAKSLISDLEKVYNVVVLNRKKGYFIIKCTF